MSEHRKLYKSRKDKLIDGVCGGIAEYFNIDPVIIRIIWAVLTVAGGVGIWAYVIAAIIIPPNPEHKDLPDDQKKTHNPQIIWGGLLILAGLFLLIGNWHFPLIWNWPFQCWDWAWWSIPWRLIGPLLLILLGAFYIYSIIRNENQPDKPAVSQITADSKRLTRPVKNKIIAGVCAAFADYFNIDPTWIRLAFVLFAVMTHGVPIGLLYIILIIVIPKAPQA